MNHLAHFHLAEPDAESRTGSLLGDFVTGLPGGLALPDGIVRGIIRHRAIDRFTDSHPLTASLKSLIAPARRRFAGVIVDLCHDHFLTRHWQRFATMPLREFTDDCNAALLRCLPYLPAELADTLDERIADDWLGRYGTDEGMDMVFRRIARRRPRFAPMRDAIEDLRRRRRDLESGFLRFYPELQAWVRRQGPESQVVIDRSARRA